MGSSLGCFGDDDNGNDTVCYSLVGVTGVSLVLLLAAVLFLSCVCWRKKRQRRRAVQSREQINSDAKYVLQPIL
jgi:hypothetical protein